MLTNFLSNHLAHPASKLLHSTHSCQDYVCARLRAIPGVNLADPRGAFYVLPEMSAFFGLGAQADGFGPVPDSDTFCRYLIEKANVRPWLDMALTLTE